MIKGILLISFDLACFKWVYKGSCRWWVRV